jgi:hypothetical protein
MAKKRKKPVVEDEDDDLEDDAPPPRSARRRDDDDDDDDYARPPRPSGPKDDAYTGLLVIALIGLIAAAVFQYLDHDSLSTQKFSEPAVAVQGLGAPPAAGG